MTDLTTKLVFDADTSGAEAGVGRVQKRLSDLGVSADEAGKKGAAGVGNIGKGAQDAAQRTDAATKNLIGSIQRTIATLDAGEKSSVKFFESIAQQRGVSTDALRPYLDQLAEAKTRAEEAGHGVEEFGFKTAGAKRELLVLAHELATGRYSRFGGSMLVLGERTGAAALLFSKAALAVLAVTGAFAALGYAAAHAEEAQRGLNSLAIQLTATGHAGEFTSSQLGDFIKQLDRMPGVTRDAATQVVSEYTKVHQIGGALFGDLVNITADYAKATGTDAPAAAKALAKAFADPERGAKTLDEALGTLTSTQILQIDQLTKQNDLVGAQKALFDALSTAVKGLATEAMTPLQTATNNFGVTWEKTMQALDKSEGLQTALGLVTKLIDKMAAAIAYLPEFEKKWRSAFTGGLNGVLFGALGIGADKSPQTGGATGSWDAPAAAGLVKPAPHVSSAADDDIKRALQAGEAFKSQAQRISELKQQRDNFNKALQESITLYGKESDQAKALRGALEGVNEQIAAAEKKGAKPYTDDAATRKLEQLRQTEASLNAQLAGEDKLTAAQKEQASFQREIADLKEKKVLTADQKSILAAKDAINAQLSVNVAVEHEIELKKEAAKLDERKAAYAKQLEAITRSYQSASENRAEQYSRVLSTVGLGDEARKEVEAQKSIYKEFQRYKVQLDKDTAGKSDAKFDAFDTDAYRNKVEELKGALSQELDALKKFYADDKAARADWRNGASAALANYVDQVNDVAKRTQTLVTQALGGLADGLTNLVMGDKGASFKQIGTQIATQITKGLVESNITKPIAEWLQQSMAGNGSGSSGIPGIFGSVLGALLGAGAGADAGGAATGLASATASDVASAGPGLMFFAGGGYTGGGGKYDPAGVVHRGEYVMTAESTSRLGVGFLDRLNRRGYADGGFVSGAMARPAGGAQAGATVNTRRNISIVMNVPRGTDNKTAAQWGAAAARQLRIAEARNA